MSNSMFGGDGRDLGKLETGLVNSYIEGAVSRRSFLVRGSVMGLSVAFLGSVIAACGDDDDSTTTEGNTPEDSSAASTGNTEAAGEIKEGGTLRVASQRPGSPIDPVAMDNLGTYTIATTAFEYLCGVGEGAAIAPMLAESLSLIHI